MIATVTGARNETQKNRKRHSVVNCTFPPFDVMNSDLRSESIQRQLQRLLSQLLLIKDGMIYFTFTPDSIWNWAILLH